MINVYSSSDYAGLRAGDFSFYYGYERIFCKKHGFQIAETTDECDDLSDECQDAEWCFEATYKDKVFAQIPCSSLETSDNFNVYECLLLGIGKVFEEKSKNDAKKR